MPRLRLLFGVILAALLITGAMGKSVWLCATGEVCHACDGCGQVDPCGDEPKDCEECCSPAELKPAASLKKNAFAALETVSESTAVEADQAPLLTAGIEPAAGAVTPYSLNLNVLDPPFVGQHGLRAPPNHS